MTREITKIGLAVMDGDRVLLVKKRGSDFLILPGGKPEKNETDVQTLSRELDEELGCRLASDRLTFLGTFSDEAAGMPGVNVTIRLYAGSVVGTPIPHAEIDSVVWWTPTEQHHSVLALAPSLKNSILPFLNSNVFARNQAQQLTNAASLR
ncbi:MAG: NUDIX domain-containing protein [Candidatus Sulfotelmatobacter sp.]